MRACVQTLRDVPVVLRGGIGTSAAVVVFSFVFGGNGEADRV